MSQSSIIFAHINARHPRRKLNVTSSLESIIGGGGGYNLYPMMKHSFLSFAQDTQPPFLSSFLKPNFHFSSLQAPSISMIVLCTDLYGKVFLLSAKWPEAFSLSPSLTLSLSSLELIENYLLYSSAAASFAYGGNQFEQESSNFGLGLPCFRRQKCCYFLIKTNSNNIE